MRQAVHNHASGRFFAGHKSFYPSVLLEKMN